MIGTLAIENYRSLRHLVVELGQLTVITGANGTGKSSVYRALRLLAGSASGSAIASLAREGGLPATLWAGPETISRSMRSGEHEVQGTRRSGPVGLRLGFGSTDLSYSVEFGLPQTAGPTKFALDPEIKLENVWSGPIRRPGSLLVERHGPAVRIRDAAGDWMPHPHSLRPYDSVLTEFADPNLAPELIALRGDLRSWRFYDHFRTDASAPARRAQLGTRTPVLTHDGSDLAAALQTIRELGSGLDAAISHAFPGSTLEIIDRDGWFELAVRQPGMLRPLAAAELSDGTLRYLLLVAALLTPRPPSLLVLNEPETSLHPDLLAPLAALVRTASERSQVIVVSHAAPLVEALTGATRIELTKDTGETVVAGRESLLEEPAWSWPKR